jgi:hypothetical protein
MQVELHIRLALLFKVESGKLKVEMWRELEVKTIQTLIALI